MIFEFFALSYGWKKEYIFNLTLPQIRLYFDSYSKRKETEFNIMHGEAGYGAEVPSITRGIDKNDPDSAVPLMPGQMKSLGIGYSTITKEEAARLEKEKKKNNEKSN